MDAIAPFLIELAMLSPAAANELGIFATNGLCSKLRARRAINAALADQVVQGEARERLQKLVHQHMLLLAPAPKVRDIKFQVRLTDTELEFIKEAAALVGMETSEYMRKKALG